jgi:hypothetical protein
MKHGFILIAALTTLAACTEKPQTLGSGAKQDVPAFQGTGMAFTVPGWKPGDKTSWEQELKTRTQNQNEYARVN